MGNGDLERHFAPALSDSGNSTSGLAAKCIERLSAEDVSALALIVLGLETNVAFLTGNGYFGRCPGRAREGDLVAVLSRSELPVVLRPHEDSTFEHVTHAYVQGVTVGEVIKEVDQNKVERRKFRLR